MGARYSFIVFLNSVYIKLLVSICHYSEPHSQNRLFKVSLLDNKLAFCQFMWLPHHIKVYHKLVDLQ